MRFTVFGDIPQVIGVETPAEVAVTEQARFTEPTNPFAGDAVTVKVLLVVAPVLMLRLPVLATSPKLGALIPTFTVTDCVMLPDVPVTENP